jgi:oxygen-dependent protoporphyrinogen oxidase
VVGGGIAGLAAALRLRELLPGARVTVYEQHSRAGGKLDTGALAGTGVELGAEAFLTRDPAGGGESAAVALARRVGLGDLLVHPAPVPAGLYLDGALHPVPGGTLLGVPGDLARVAELARPDPAADRDLGRPLLRPGEDVAVGALVRSRFGDQVVDRLVDPMLGGVYAGHADQLSLAATMPGLAAACRRETTLTGAVRAALAAAPGRAEPGGGAAGGPTSGGPGGPGLPRPVFTAVRGGVGRLVEAVAAAGGARLRLGRPVRELAPAGRGWRLLVGSTRDAEPAAAAAVVLALPARPAARLLVGVDRPAAGLVGVLDYASVALVTLAFPAEVELPEWSGFLVPSGEGVTIKAATFLSRKWPHLGEPGGPVLVRASVGRYGEPGPLRLADPELVRLAHTDLRRVLGDLPEPVAGRVRRWGGALPQYAPGHLDRVAAARVALPPTLGLAGAAYDGVGIPACVRSGEAAAEQVAAALGGRVGGRDVRIGDSGTMAV